MLDLLDLPDAALAAVAVAADCSTRKALRATCPRMRLVVNTETQEVRMAGKRLAK